ncbi:HTH_Tnp_Tc3_2 domain-containing protein [Trichonephila clavipes]|uniref:HTH_Tnp_Tc3_2 domain-containing protein n=1 Tax=Trichonephila clavipes TaxID=2585209 RepID=A0A8X6RFT5_TRICX|nr:HTH_Tnp_Tc3_2 domain-containing protein [Trichonephila clavipes]
MIVQFRNEKVSNHGSIPITIDCNVVALIVFEEGFDQPIKHTKQRLRLRTNRRSVTHGLLNFRNRQTARIVQVNSAKSISRINGWWTKTSDRANCKGQLALTVLGERRLIRTERSQRRAKH